MSCNKPCSKCGTVIYLQDLLRCMDRVWHKTCFRCTVCEKILTAANYTVHEKLPYCETHCPELKPTLQADAIAIKRAAELTKIQSPAAYRQDYDATKGDKLSVADDVLTTHALKSTKNTSPAAYRGEAEKKEKMEQDRQRILAEAPPSYSTKTLSPMVKDAVDQIETAEEKRRTQDAALAASPYVQRSTSPGVKAAVDQIEAAEAQRKAQATAQSSKSPSSGSPQLQKTNVGSPSPRAESEARSPTSFGKDRSLLSPAPCTTKIPSRGIDLSRASVALIDQNDDSPRFKRIDYIVDCEPRGGGYVIGTVLRTGERGMIEGHSLGNVIDTDVLFQ